MFQKIQFSQSKEEAKNGDVCAWHSFQEYPYEFGLWQRFGFGFVYGQYSKHLVGFGELTLLHYIKNLLWPLLWAKFHWKIPLGEWFFKFLAKIEMTQNKNRLFGSYFEAVQLLTYLLQNYDFLECIHIWCESHCKIPLGKWFSTVGSLGIPPWAPTGVKVPWSLKGSQLDAFSP